MARIGDTIGSYQITSLLGSGGMAMVYAARHTSIGTEHALKVLLPNYASQPRTVERFRQEARAQFRMRHAHIVQVTDFVDDGENLALVMDLISGMTLAEAIRLRPGPWPVADVVAVMKPVLEAMTFAHREGLDGAAVVHRDLKPENILLDLSRERPWPGIPKVADFGIAKVLGASNIATATNARMGTPGYMAPEQARNAKDAGAPADVWALGVMLWQLLAGRLPVDPENSLELVKFYEGLTPIPRLAQVVAGVPERLSEVVAQATALRPEERFQDASPLLRAMEGAVEAGRVVGRVEEAGQPGVRNLPDNGEHLGFSPHPTPPRSNKYLVGFAGVFLLATTALGGVWLFKEKPPEKVSQTGEVTAHNAAGPVAASQVHEPGQIAPRHANDAEPSGAGYDAHGGTNSPIQEPRSADERDLHELASVEKFPTKATNIPNKGGPTTIEAEWEDAAFRAAEKDARIPPPRIKNAPAGPSRRQKTPAELADAQNEAAKFAALAQKANTPKLKVLYLRKAAEKDPGNGQYKNLLQQAEIELGSQRP